MKSAVAFASLIAAPAVYAASATGLHGKFVANKGKLFFGTAADQNRFSQSNDATVTIREFGGVTPENSMKWDTVQPSAGNFNFNGADALVNFAIQNGMIIRGHTFVWAQQLPSFVQNLAAAQMSATLNTHITTVMTRYKGKIFAYDVVNEHINEDGSIKSTPWTQKLGNAVFSQAFKTARSVDPDAKLYINDFNLDSNNAKVRGIVSLVNSLNTNGNIVIDGIGTQAHLTGGQGAGFQGGLTALAAANGPVQVAITELDIANAPANDYQQVAKACIAVSNCVSITVWGVADKDSWRASTNPLLFDSNFGIKPAYTAVSNVF